MYITIEIIMGSLMFAGLVQLHASSRSVKYYTKKLGLATSVPATVIYSQALSESKLTIVRVCKVLVFLTIWNFLFTVINQSMSIAESYILIEFLVLLLPTIFIYLPFIWVFSVQESLLSKKISALTNSQRWLLIVFSMVIVWNVGSILWQIPQILK